MRFSTFLATQVGGMTPVQRVKQDLAHYKAIFSYADKSDMLYQNLIDNIFWMLESKFSRFVFRYTRYETCYNEFNLILSTQIPQFLLIQKKQLAEQLNVFGELKNWGKNNVEKIARIITGTDNYTSNMGFTPIDQNRTDPYSKEQNDRTNRGEENVTNEKQANDFLNFYSKVKWDLGSVDLDSILKPYYSLFMAVQLENDEFEVLPSLYDELKALIDENASKIEENTVLINSKANEDEVVKLTGNQEIQGTKNFRGAILVPGPGGDQHATNKRYVDNRTYSKEDSDNRYYQKSQVYNKGESDNKYPLKTNVYTKTESDGRYYGKSSVYTKTEANEKFVDINADQTIKGNKKFYRALDMTNEKIFNLETPTNNSDAANKLYVDGGDWVLDVRELEYTEPFTPSTVVGDWKIHLLDFYNGLPSYVKPEHITTVEMIRRSDQTYWIVTPIQYQVSGGIKLWVLSSTSLGSGTNGLARVRFWKKKNQ